MTRAIADLDTVVVGGGIVGLAITRALSLAGHDVVLLEQHEGLGAEISSHNSEVIHAGIYYPPGSLRAKFCVEGRQLLYRFLSDNGVSHRRIGKLLVASGDDQLPELAKYAETARRNGVDDLQRLTAEEARKLEPEVACAGALLSPSTGIVDSHGLILALAGEAEASGAQIVLRSKVVSIEAMNDGLFGLRLAGAEHTPVTVRKLMLSGGLHATELARSVRFREGYAPPETYFARGRYYALRGPSPFHRLIYPMPQPGGLGVHLTLDLAGRAKFGPDVAWIPSVDYRFDESAEQEFYDAIRSYWPGLRSGALQPDTTGVRPKLARQGEPAADFAIHGSREHGLANLVCLYGIESPGLTSCLAIGDYVRDMLNDYAKA